MARLNEEQIAYVLSQISPIEQVDYEDGNISIEDLARAYPPPAKLAQKKNKEAPTKMAGLDRLSEGEDQGWAGTVVDASQGMVQEGLGLAGRYHLDNPINDQSAVEQFIRVGGVTGALAEKARQALTPDSWQEAQDANIKDLSTRALEAAAPNQEAVKAYREREDVPEGWEGGARGIGLTIAENPDQLLGLVGRKLGPMGRILTSVPATRVYLKEYYSALDAGVPEDEAKARAASMAALELAGEQAGGLFGGGKKLATSIGSKILGGTLREGAEEMVTEVAQGGLDTILGQTGVGGEKLQKFTRSQGFQDLKDAILRTTYSGAVGSVGGGGISAITAHAETSNEILNNVAEAYVRGAITNAERIELIVEAGKRASDALADPATQKTGLEGGLKPPSVGVRLDYGPGDLVAKADVKKEAERLAKPIVEAEKAVVDYEKDQAAKLKKAVDAAQSKHLKERTAEKNRLAAEVSASKATDKPLTSNHIIDGLAKWHTANPAPTVETIKEKLAAETTKKGKLVNQRKVDDVTSKMKDTLKSEDEGVVDTEDQMSEEERVGVENQLKQEVLKQQPPSRSKEEEGARVTSIDEIIRKQAKKMTVRESNSLVLASREGRVKFVRDGDIVNGKPFYSNGLYDGEFIYLNENTLDRKDPKDWGSVAKHEVGHYFDHAAKAEDVVKHLKPMKETFESDLARVHQLAKSGNVIAKKAVTRAEGARAKEIEETGNTTKAEARYKEEVGKYFFEEASLAAKKGILGRANGVYRSMLGAAKNSALSKILGPLDTIKDSNYVAEERLANIGKVTAPGKGNVHLEAGGIKDNLESFGGMSGRSYHSADKDGETWVAKDGRRRYYISDAGAQVSVDFLRNFSLDTEYPANVVLQHPTLFKEYPLLKGITVKVRKDDPKGLAEATDDGAILVNQSLLKKPKAFASTLLHELQHQIQNIENFARGSSPDMFRDKEKVLRTYASLARQLSQIGAAGQLHERLAKHYLYPSFTEMRADLPNWTPVQKKAYMLTRAIERVSNDWMASGRKEGKYGAELMKYTKDLHATDAFFLKSMTETVDFVTVLANLDKQALDGYRDTLGEQEARLTQQLFEDDDLRERTERLKGAGRFHKHAVSGEFAPVAPIASFSEKGLNKVTQRSQESQATEGDSLESFRERGFGEFSRTVVEDWTNSLTKIDQVDALAAGDREVSYVKRLRAWGERAAKNYLNKYAGTPEDPLKDIKIGEEGTSYETWEQNWDGLVERYGNDVTHVTDAFSPAEKAYYETHDVELHAEVKSNRRRYQREKKLLGIPENRDTTIFEPNSVHIDAFVNHVGDYLQQTGLLNIENLDRLERYDFVRAAKETIAWDKENLKNAEKLRKERAKNQDKSVTVVRKYADGMKWVKLDKPGQFAAESDIMGHSVRGYEPPKYHPAEWTRRYEQDEWGPNGEHPDWTPEAGEGGHPGYGLGGWEAIKSGRAAIYSLRDKDGLSHVTVEVENVDNMREFDTAKEEFVGEPTSSKSISQIKGKGNNKPVGKYIPYVRDFVRNLGPWERVGDSQNADLFPIMNGDRSLNGKLFTPEEKLSMTRGDSRLGEMGDIPGLPDVLESRDDLETRDISVGSLSRRDAYRQASDIFRRAVNLLSYKQGLPMAAVEARERSISEPSEYYAVALAARNDLAHAIEESGIDMDAFQKKYEAEEDAAKRELILNAMGREHPEVARGIRVFREIIDNDLADKIIFERAKILDTHPLSKSEAAIYKKIMENKGRYVMRNYALTFGERGGEFGKRTFDAFERTKASGGVAATPGEQEAYARVVNAMKYLSGQISIPETLPTDARELTKLYNNWYSHKGGDTPDIMRQRLEELRAKLTPEMVNNQLEGIVRQILGIYTVAAGGLAEQLSGLARNNTIVTARSVIPEEIRQLMGEVNDAPLRLMLTVQNMANFVARTKFLGALSGMKDLVITDEERLDPKNSKFSEPLSGSVWGPLEGSYVTPHMYTHLASIVVPLVNFEQATILAAHRPGVLAALSGMKFFQAWGAIAHYTKMALIVGNPLNYALNTVGNLANLMRQGNLNPHTLYRSIKVAKELVGSRSRRDFSPDTRKVMRAGVADSAQVGETQGEAIEVFEDYVYGETYNSPMDKVRSMAKVAKSWLLEFYAMTDVLSKISNFLYLEQQLTEYHKLNGDNLTEEQIEREAASQVSNDNVTYKRALPAAKVTESSGLTMIAPYVAETFRTQVWNVLYAGKELKMAASAKTPAARMKMLEMAGRRIFGTYMAGFMLTSMLEAVAGGGDDDDLSRKIADWLGFDKDSEQVRAAKAALPEYAQTGHPMYVGLGEDGKPLFYGLSRVDPAGPFTDFIRAIQQGKMDTAEEVLNRVRDLIISPRIASPLFSALEESIKPTSTAQDVREKTERALSYALPSWLRNASTPDRGFGGKTDYPTGLGPTSAIAGVVKALGGRLDRGDPELLARDKMRQFHDVQKKGRREVFQSLAADEPISTEAFLTQLESARKEEREKFNELVNMDKALTAMGQTPRQRLALYTSARVGMSKELAGAVLRGQNLDKITTLLNKNSVKSSYEFVAPRDQAKVARNIQRNAKILEDLGFTFK